jgi:hypothetical protein
MVMGTIRDSMGANFMKKMEGEIEDREMKEEVE